MSLFDFYVYGLLSKTIMWHVLTLIFDFFPLAAENPSPLLYILFGKELKSTFRSLSCDRGYFSNDFVIYANA